jgi:hypothetical protein
LVHKNTDILHKVCAEICMSKFTSKRLMESRLGYLWGESSKLRMFLIFLPAVYMLHLKFRTLKILRTLFLWYRGMHYKPEEKPSHTHARTVCACVRGRFMEIVPPPTCPITGGLCPFSKLCSHSMCIVIDTLYFLQCIRQFRP